MFTVRREHQLTAGEPDFFYELIDRCQAIGMFIDAADVNDTNASRILFHYLPIDFRVSFATVANQQELQMRERVQYDLMLLFLWLSGSFENNK